MRHYSDGQLPDDDRRRWRRRRRRRPGRSWGPAEQRWRRPQLAPQRVAVGAVLDHRLADLVAALEVHGAWRDSVGAATSAIRGG